MKSRGNMRFTTEYGYILKNYTSMLFFALKRTRATRQDVFSLLFLLSASLLYFLGFKGELKTPIGRLLVSNRKVLRSFTYGFFKTYYAYLCRLRALSPKSPFFPVVFDIGANIGDFTLAMRNISGKIVAVEPAKENFLALEANLQINNVKNVVPIEAAATDKEGEVFLQGESSDMYVARTGNGQSAKGMPLDSIVRELNIGSVDLLKIDVQGHEMVVLSGMFSLLKEKSVNYVIVEVHIKRGVSTDNVISFMKSHEYDLMHKDSYVFMDQPHLYFVRN